MKLLISFSFHSFFDKQLSKIQKVLGGLPNPKFLIRLDAVEIFGFDRSLIFNQQIFNFYQVVFFHYNDIEYKIILLSIFILGHCTVLKLFYHFST